MRIEDLRGPKVADTALVVASGAPRLAAFHHHATQGEWHTLNTLGRVAGLPTDGIANEAMAVVEWWRTVESLVALLHSVAVEEAETGLRPEVSRRPSSTRNDSVVDRWSGICAWFSNATRSAPSSTTGLLTELRDFRNSFEHASRESACVMKHSRLASTPAHANVADAMEALAICVLVCDFVRDVLPGVDLMPQVPVHPPFGGFVWAPLDEFAADLAFPIYRHVVSALGLETDIAPYPPSERLRGHALIDAKIVIKAVSDAADFSTEEPLDIGPAFEAFARARSGDGTVRLPSYAVDPQQRTRDRARSDASDPLLRLAQPR